MERLEGTFKWRTYKDIQLEVLTAKVSHTRGDLGGARGSTSGVVIAYGQRGSGSFEATCCRHLATAAGVLGDTVIPLDPSTVFAAVPPLSKTTTR